MVHLENCFCEKLNKLTLKTRVSLIIFRKEIKLPSNTAHVALKSLENSQFFERGHKDQHLSEEFISNKDFAPLYLYPSDDSIELTTDLLKDFKRPINLIIPDGTWRQAKKIQRREPLLNDIQAVRISPSHKSIYPLRRQKFDEGLCTYEAMAEALKIIEGEDAYQKVMNNFHIFLDAHLRNRMIFDKP